MVSKKVSSGYMRFEVTGSNVGRSIFYVGPKGGLWMKIPHPYDE